MIVHNHIHIVDDEPLTRKSLYEILKRQGYKVSTSSDGEEAWASVRADMPDIVIADLKMPKTDGFTLLRKIKAVYPEIAVVLITAYGSIENAVEAMREGAFDYITKPIIDNEIKIVIQRIFEQKKLLAENKSLRQQLDGACRGKFHHIIGQNHALQKIYRLVETVAPTNATVLIQGESGTGKRLIAQALHKSDSHRKDKPFVEVSCGALPETLLESELFGHLKGSFTGAIKDREGRFEKANGGTIFLDEIDAFSPKLQVKLLRILQEGEFERVGDTTTIKVDVRVIAATNQELQTLIQQGLFRDDLYYRLNVIPITVPPLRERTDDIPLLTEHFLKKCVQKMKDKKIEGVSEAVLELFARYAWPGNVRELENVIERAVILCNEPVIKQKDLPDFFGEIALKEHSPITSPHPTTLKDALRLSEQKIIEDALSRCGGNRKKAADMLGINRTTLYNKMKEFNQL